MHVIRSNGACPHTACSCREWYTRDQVLSQWSQGASRGQIEGESSAAIATCYY